MYAYAHAQIPYPYTRIYTHLHIDMYVCVSRHDYVDLRNVNTNIYIYIYIYIIYIYIYIYAYIYYFACCVHITVPKSTKACCKMCDFSFSVHQFVIAKGHVPFQRKHAIANLRTERLRKLITFQAETFLSGLAQNVERTTHKPTFIFHH